MIADKRLSASTDFKHVKEAAAVIICVPSPLNKNREPDISFIIETGRMIAPHLSKGALVYWNRQLIREPQTRICARYRGRFRVEGRSGFSPGVSHRSGRILATRTAWLQRSQRLSADYTPGCLKKAIEVYSMAIKELVPVSSCRVAEAAKLLENIFRSVNIALVNELKLVYGAMGIDIWEVIDAARTKPFGFMAVLSRPRLRRSLYPD